MSLREALARRAGAALVVAALLVAGVALPAAAAEPPGRTIRASVPDGWSGGPHDPGGELSLGSDISGDGRFVAFVSTASNLVPGDTNGVPDIFVRDLVAGSTERVSVASDGTEANDWSALFAILWDPPSISADGRYVAFMSQASNLAPGDTNGMPDAFVHDRLTGMTEVVSVSNDGEIGDFTTQAVDISADGRYVAMESAARNLVPGDTNGHTDIFVHDRQTGETELVSVATDGAFADDVVVQPAISGDGRYVAFTSAATNLVPDDTNGTVHETAGRDVFVHDRETGATTRASVATDGTQGNSFSQFPAISNDGSAVAFISLSANLAPNDANGDMDVFVRDIAAGTTERVSVGLDGSEAGPVSNIPPAISADGRAVAFTTWAEDVMPGDGNDLEDVFVADRTTGAVERASVGGDGAEGDSYSSHPGLSTDGRQVSFTSEASNLVPGEDDGCGGSCRDVFVRDRGPELGVGEVTAIRSPGSLEVAGWARLGEHVLAQAPDAPDDGSANAAALGGELHGAAAVYRPEVGDLLLRVRVRRLPGFRPAANPWPGLPPDPGFLWCPNCALVSASGAPGVRYGVSFEVGAASYEARAERGPGETSDPAVAFGLYRCDEGCERVAALTGGYGTRGEAVEISLPLQALGVGPGAALGGLRAFALAALEGQQLEVLDEVALGGAPIPMASVEAGIAPTGSPPEAVASWSAVGAAADGHFAGAIPAPEGPHRLWVRACVGDRCGATPLEIA